MQLLFEGGFYLRAASIKFGWQNFSIFKLMSLIRFITCSLWPILVFSLVLFHLPTLLIPPQFINLTSSGIYLRAASIYFSRMSFAASIQGRLLFASDFHSSKIRYFQHLFPLHTEKIFTSAFVSYCSAGRYYCHEKEEQNLYSIHFGIMIVWK